MSTIVSDPLVDPEARRAGEDVARLAGVHAVCVIGSSARGDSDQSSDIDLLALVIDREAASSVRTNLASVRAGRPVQLKLVTEPRLTQIFEGRSTFAVHVLREAIVVFDPGERFDALRQLHSRNEPVRDNREDLLIRLELYADLEWCQGLYLYCLSDLYAIGRTEAYTILGRDSRFEFSGMRAFQSAALHHPSLASSAERIAGLRPFFLLAERDQTGPLPFPYRDCHHEAGKARDACCDLVDRIH